MAKFKRDANKSTISRSRLTENHSEPFVDFKRSTTTLNFVEDGKRKFENRLEKIKRFPESKNKQIVLEYLKSKESQSLTYHRLVRISDFLLYLLTNFDFDFSKITQKNIEDILIWINEKDWKDWTKYTYQKILKSFLYWLEEKYDIDLKVRKIKTITPKNSLMPEYLITEEEFQKLINATDDLQTKLLVGLLYESGVRIGELLSLAIKNVSFNNYGAKLSVKGKTGQRVIPIIWFSNMLRQFVESHPLKEDPEAPLFFYINKFGELRPLVYPALRMRLKRLCKKVGIKKRIHPHLFRHTRLTELAKQLPEEVLKQMAGWSASSKMAKTYVHLSNKDIEESLLTKVYGLKISESNGEQQKLKVCSKCGETNLYFAKICQRCKTPLEENKLAQMVLSEEQMKEINEWSEVFLSFFKAIEKKYPDVWQEIARILKEKGKEHLLEER